MGTEENTEAPKKKRTGRSPAYPNFDVIKALKQAKALYKEEGEYAAPYEQAASAWGYSPKSSGGRQTLASLKYYGLIEISGDGDTRKIKISDIAKRILLDEREDETEKKSLIRKVALTPAAHKTLFNEYPDGLASDGSVTHFLVFDNGFKPDAANDLLAQFKSTSSYSGLYQPHKGVDKPEDLPHYNEDETPPLKIGDKVQWTNNGMDMFAHPATILGFSEDHLWAYTDQGQSAAAIEELKIMEVDTVPIAPLPPAIPAHIIAAREALKSGAYVGERTNDDQVVLTKGKLKSGSFEVRVTGEIGAKEIGKIIKLLEAQKLILDDDEDD